MIRFPEEYNVHLCVAHQISLGGPAKWAANGPAWTGSAQTGLLYRTLFFFPLQLIPPWWHGRPDNATIFPPFFNELTNTLNCLSVSTRRFGQQFSYITQQKQTNKKTLSSLHGITVEYEDKRNMMQWCFYNWFSSTVHSIMVHRNPITTNCSSKHERLVCNDSMSLTLSIFFLHLCNYSSSSALTMQWFDRATPLLSLDLND